MEQVEVHNPYAAPAAHVAQPVVDSPIKADRATRLGAAIVDNILYSVAFVPGMLVLQGAVSFGTTGVVVSSLLAIAGFALFFYNLTLLQRDGQTLAKRWLGIRIVRKNGKSASLGRLFWLRMALPAAISMIPLIGNFFGLLNALAIFGQEKRCLHDLFADTIVVNA